MLKQREDLKKYIKRSIIEEELNSYEEQSKGDYKHIYSSKVKNVTGLGTAAAGENANSNY